MGPFDRFNDRAKRVLALAQDEAIRLNHNYIRTEHLLLGLVRERGHVGAKVLESLDVTLEKVREHVIAIVGQPHGYASGPRPDPRDLPSSGPFDLLDRTATRVLALAEEEARLMRHNWIGTEHMLIALLRTDGIAQRALQELAVTLEQARAGWFKAVPPRAADVTELTVTPRVRTLMGKAITLAAPAADLVKPQHPLLALVTDPGGIRAQVLTQPGVTPEKLRQTIDRLSAR